MVTITNMTMTREQVRTAFQCAPDVRLRERYHAILLPMDSKSCPEVARWLYRNEATIRTWVHVLNTAGFHGLERATAPGRPT
jgi:transposase